MGRAEDHLDILNIVHSYSWNVDMQELESLKAVFHHDAVINGFGHSFGRDDYCETIMLTNKGMKTVHMISNEIVDIEGLSARCRSDILGYHSVLPEHKALSEAVFGDITEPTDSLILARYDDFLEKRDGKWKIKEKRITMVWQQQFKTLPPFPGWPRE